MQGAASAYGLTLFLALAGCGGGSPAPSPDLAPPPDLYVERHPELLIGAWSFTITQSATCSVCAGCSSSPVTLNGTMHIASGGDPSTVVTHPDGDACPVTWTVVGSSATLDAGQTCIATGSDNSGPFDSPHTYFAGTITTIDGKTGTYHDSFHETKTRNGSVYESCDIMRNGSLTRMGP